MKRIILIKTTLILTLLTFTCISSLKAQLFYQDNHLFIGQKPLNWTTVDNGPQTFIGPEWGIGYYEAGLNFYRPLGASAWGNYKMFIDDSSRVGIARKPVTYALEVNGSVWTTSGLLIASDKRLKRNISNLSDVRYGYLNKLLKLEGKTYEKQISSSEGNADEVAKMVKGGLINSEDASEVLASLNKNNPTIYKQEFGFIAQEMQELFPELVEEGNDGILSINYIGLIPLLVESFKDLQNQISEIESLMEGTISTRIEETDNELIPIPGAILHQSVPNPSGIGVTIDYELPESYVSANIFVFNVSGFQVKNFSLTGPSGQVKIAINELPAGNYFYTLTIDGQKVDTKKMVLTN